MRPSRSILCLCVLVALVLAACAVGEAPAATVGDAEISSAQLSADVPLYRFLAGLSGAPCGTPQGNESADAACTRFTLGNDIREEIVKAYAIEHDLSVNRDDVDQAIAQVAQSLGGDAALEQQLRDGGLERADLVVLARRLLLFGEVQTVVADERLSDDTLRALYEQDLAQFTTVQVSHILVETEEEAARIADRATPANFAALAADLSIDTQSAQNGGDLGAYSEAQFRSSFDPTFVEAALSLQPGEISGPVQTQFGWHVIELVREDTASFEEVRDQLAARQGGQIFNDWLAERYQALDVEVNPRYGRLDPSTGEVLPVRSTDDGAVSPSPTPAGSTGGATGAPSPSPAGATSPSP